MNWKAVCFPVVWSSDEAYSLSKPFHNSSTSFGSRKLSTSLFYLRPIPKNAEKSEEVCYSEEILWDLQRLHYVSWAVYHISSLYSIDSLHQKTQSTRRETVSSYIFDKLTLNIYIKCHNLKQNPSIENFEVPRVWIYQSRDFTIDYTQRLLNFTNVKLSFVK